MYSHHYFSFFATLAVLSVFFVSVPQAQAQTCTNQFTASTTVPTGFGAAYDLFSPTHELLIRGTCTDKNIFVTVGSGKTNQYIYGQAMYWNGNTWNTAALTSTHPVGVWHVGSAFANIPSSAKETQVIAYICEQVGGAWKCGCRDNACTQALWQLQTVVRPSAPSSSSSGSEGRVDSSVWLMGYYAGFQAGTFPVSEIDYSLITHIAVGAVKPKADGTLDTSFDRPGDDGGAMAKRIARDAHKAGKKALLWVGGSDSNDVWKQAASDAHRTAFARNLLDLMDDLGYDGLDLDWEPIDAEDHDEVLALVKELRKRDADALLTLPVMWVTNNKDRTAELAWYADVSDYVDKVFVMTYSMTGVWSGWQSWFNSPLYGESTKTPASIDHSITSYLKAGIPKKKLGFGIGFYGRCFAPPITTPRMDIPATYSWSVTSLPYSTVLDVLKDSEATYVWDAKARVPYLYRTSSSKMTTYCSYLTYDDERSITEKTNYLKSQGLGGIILWTLGSGYVSNPTNTNNDNRQSLLQAAYKGVVGK